MSTVRMTAARWTEDADRADCTGPHPHATVHRPTPSPQPPPCAPTATRPPHVATVYFIVKNGTYSTVISELSEHSTWPSPPSKTLKWVMAEPARPKRANAERFLLSKHKAAQVMDASEPSAHHGCGRRVKNGTYSTTVLLL